MRARAFARPLLGLAAAILVSACGGGGGSDGSTPPVVTTGLVPAAPTPGATLYADATALRPLVANGSWTYRGIEKIDASGVPTVYNNIVTHQAGAGGAVTEVGTNDDNGGTSQQTVAYRAGEVHATSSISLSSGPPQVLDQLELRSPVRVDDQYTILDIHQADGGIDLDGDGKNDGFDLAIYSRVIGAEVVDLPSFPQVQTVHVKTTLLTRFKLSKAGTYTDIGSGTIDYWYAAGVGIVKRGSDVPGPVTGTRQLTTETLVNWDGVDRGVGFLDPKALTTSTGTPLSYIVGAVGFDAHALLMTYTGPNAVAGLTLSQIDARGALLSSQPVAPGLWASNTQLVRLGTGAAVLGLDASGLEMYSFDAAGNPTQASPVLLKRGSVGQTGTAELFVAAASADTLWVSWIEPPADQSTPPFTLMAQPFDKSGAPLAGPSTLATVATPTGISNLAADGAPGHVILVWDENQAGVWSKRYALVDGQGAGVPVGHTAQPGDGPLARMQPAASTSGSTLLWLYPYNGGAPQLNGISFGANGEPWRSNAVSLEAESLALPWLSNSQQLWHGNDGAARLYTVVNDYQKLWPEDSLESSVTFVTELSPGNGPLATNNGARLLARGALPPSLGNVVVGLSGNVLVFADTTTGPKVTSVWRRP